MPRPKKRISLSSLYRLVVRARLSDYDSRRQLPGFLDRSRTIVPCMFAFVYHLAALDSIVTSRFVQIELISDYNGLWRDVFHARVVVNVWACLPI